MQGSRAGAVRPICEVPTTGGFPHFRNLELVDSQAASRSSRVRERFGIDKTATQPQVQKEEGLPRRANQSVP